MAAMSGQESRVGGSHKCMGVVSGESIVGESRVGVGHEWVWVTSGWHHEWGATCGSQVGGGHK